MGIPPRRPNALVPAAHAHKNRSNLLVDLVKARYGSYINLSLELLCIGRPLGHSARRWPHTSRDTYKKDYAWSNRNEW